MTEDACLLDLNQRAAVDAVIRRHCVLRGWTLHALNVRTNHVHVVVASGEASPKRVREELKSWSTRTLKKVSGSGREKWWTAGGDIAFLFSDAALAEKIEYVLHGQ
ncbi:transposase [Alienimonas californiensis]|uniref:Transposase IS200 like protein n=1 Tax=Alienimonas californiensis TaxID=2527989 RepID=A0A517PAT5_9PLAN|nr:transposase [Alienimonas californiensis]QDT16489.1 Transposase IS200 like protein [Alienimonas californiensis]